MSEVPQFQESEVSRTEVHTNVMDASTYERMYGGSEDYQKAKVRLGTRFMNLLRNSADSLVSTGGKAALKKAKQESENPMDQIDLMQKADQHLQVPVKNLGAKTSLDVTTDNIVQVSHNLTDNLQAKADIEGVGLSYSKQSENEKDWQVQGSAGVDFEGKPQGWLKAVKKF